MSKEEDVAWREQVAAVAESGAYKSVSRAAKYVDRYLGDAWRAILHIDNDDDPLDEQLDLTPTQTQLLHLYAKGVWGHGVSKSVAPRLTSFLPVRSHATELRPPAVSKRDAARIVGRSVSSVEEAIARFRGKRGDLRMFDRRLVGVLFVETGIMLDIATSQQQVFNCMREVYVYGGIIARESGLRDAPTIQQQREWCADAIPYAKAESEMRSELAAESATAEAPAKVTHA